MEKKKLHGLMIDFKNYAIILLAVSTFLYIGVVIPDQGKSELYDIILMVSTIALLVISFLCFKRSLFYKKQYDNIEE
ncbi:YrhC family protein [Metabacillus malikii]|uniref:YrhC-like protein n=1 Tax=Metabacillus malikii TaxID=1504265 RepID=A0ABT9ZHU8_9BACI|nr:YrhC family protein [Metabacillus malikii]MDQ0231555.1 hypothetical protein [Metabacillus malikii]